MIKKLFLIIFLFKICNCIFSYDRQTLLEINEVTQSFIKIPETPEKLQLKAKSLIQLLNFTHKNKRAMKPRKQIEGEERKNLMKSCISLAFTYAEGDYAKIKKQRIVSDFEKVFMRYEDKQLSENDVNSLLGCFTTILASVYYKDDEKLSLADLSDKLREDYELFRIGREGQFTNLLLKNQYHLKESILKFLEKDSAFIHAFNELKDEFQSHFQEWSPEENEKDIRIVKARDDFNECVGVYPYNVNPPKPNLPLMSGFIVKLKDDKFLITSAHTPNNHREKALIKYKNEWCKQEVPLLNVSERMVNPFLEFLAINPEERKKIDSEKIKRKFEVMFGLDFAIGLLDNNTAIKEAFPWPEEHLPADLELPALWVGYGWVEDIVNQNDPLLTDGQKRYHSGYLLPSVLTDSEQLIINNEINEEMLNVFLHYQIKTPKIFEKGEDYKSNGYEDQIANVNSGAPLFRIINKQSKLIGILRGGDNENLSGIDFIALNKFNIPLLTALMSLLAQKQDISDAVLLDLLKKHESMFESIKPDLKKYFLKEEFRL